MESKHTFYESPGYPALNVGKLEYPLKLKLRLCCLFFFVSWIVFGALFELIQ